MKILIASSFSKSLINFRLNLIIDLLKQGHEIIALGNEYDQHVELDLKKINVKFVIIPLKRDSISIKDISYILSVFKLIYHQISVQGQKNQYHGIILEYTKYRKYIQLMVF